MGIIAKPVIEDFINRPLRDSSKAKRFSVKALDRKIAKIRPKLKFLSPPRNHQKVCLLLGLKYPGYMHLLDMGLGKTFVHLHKFSYWKKVGKVKRGLVLVPNVGNVAGWLKQVKQHTPWIKAVGISQTGEESRLEAVNSDADLVICTYMGWLALIKHVVKNRRTGKNEWEIHASKATKLEKQFQSVCFDEITNIMNHSSLFARAAHRLSRKCFSRDGLTGTPFGNNPEAMWSQFYATDRGETLGETLGLYRACFFKPEANPWTGYDVYKFDKRKAPLLARMIRHGSIAYALEDCEDLPKLTEYTQTITLPPENRTYQQKLIAELKEAQGAFKLLDNVWHRLRQLPSGYLVVKDPEGEKITIKFKDNPKLEALVELLKEINPKRKIIVYADYMMTGDLISARLTKEKVNHVRFYSKTKNKGEILEQFCDDPKVRVLIGSRSILYGHNLQAATYIICYETPPDPKDLKQLRGRIRRIGQDKKTFIIYLAIAKTIDMKIMKAQAEGKNLYKSIVQAASKGRHVKAETADKKK